MSENLLRDASFARYCLDMISSETFAQAAGTPARTISRRQVLQVLAASLVAAQVTGFGNVGLVPANASNGSNPASVAYDGIVGLL